MTKLTPRQNELISEALVRYAAENFHNDLPQDLNALRETLVTELSEVTARTEADPYSEVPRSISG